MTTSILDDVKHMVGIDAEETAFDMDVITHTNSAFSTLSQLGVGPVAGFYIVDNTTTWDQFVTDPRLNAVKSYVFLCVKMLFDPPDTGFVLSSMDRQKQEMEYRLNVAAEYG